MDKIKPETSPPIKQPSVNPIKKQGFIIMVILNILLLMLNILLLYLLPSKVNQVIQTRSEILAQELQTQSAQKLISDINSSQADEELIYASLPTKSLVLNAIEFLEGLNSETYSTNFTFESEDPKRDEKGHSFLPLTVVLNGKLNETMNALEKIKHSPYLFTVSQTLIESPNGLGENSIVHVSLQIYVRQPFKDN